MALTRKERLLKAMLEDNLSGCGTAMTREEKILAGVAKKACENDALDGGGGGNLEEIERQIASLNEEIDELKGGGSSITQTGAVVVVDTESGKEMEVSAESTNAVTLCHHGKNFFPSISEQFSQYSVTGSPNEDGTCHIEGTGTNTAYINIVKSDKAIYIPAGSYVVSTNAPENIKIRLRYGSDVVFANLTSQTKVKTVTITEGIYLYGYYEVASGVTVNADVWVQVEMGDNVLNATAFEKCTRTNIDATLPTFINSLGGVNVLYTETDDTLTVTVDGGGRLSVDATLTLEGFAADAKATGDALAKNNLLNGKVWAVFGDSFTNGGYSKTDGFDESVYKFQSGRFANKQITYPYIIAERNNMEIARFFEGGRTLANPSDGSFTNSITNPASGAYYQDIPENADYITIYLGINDSHHEEGSTGDDGEDTTGVIPLGTIDDTDVSTFCGAWNVVLPWLMTNRPNAHIGIIVSNGVDRVEYRTATIAAAKKWGIPYLDLNGDERCPAMIRPVNPDISTDAKNILKQKWRVSETNSHPNTAAHYFQSTFIESWLRTL